MNSNYDIIIIGGGAAGFFTAINIVEKNSKLKVAVLERGKSVLEKVRISVVGVSIVTGGNGGSGGGGSYAQSVGTGTAGQGNNGGSGNGSSPNYGGGDAGGVDGGDGECECVDGSVS